MARDYNYSSADDDVRIMLSLVTDTVVDDTIVEYFIEKADNYIDSRVAKRYDVPFTQSTTPPIITDVSANLAAYRVLKRLKLEVSENEEDYARTFYNDAMRILKDIDTGKIEILDSNGDIILPLSSTGIVSSTSNYRPVFSEDTELDWEINSDKISDGNKKYS